MSKGYDAVRKLSYHVQMSRDMAIDCGLIEPTPEEARRREEAHLDYVRRRESATAAWPMLVQQFAAVREPIARAVLDLHKPDDHGQCAGCDWNGFEGEPGEWPCRTVHAVAPLVGVEIPADIHYAVQIRP